MKKLCFALLTLGLGLYTSESQAQIFKLEFTPAAGLNAAVTTLINTEIKKIEADINKDLPGADSPDRLMEGMANSSVMAGKGIGTDYASGMKLWIVGVGVGAGADLTKDKEAKTDLSGAGVQPGLMIGTKLSWMDAEKILGLETNKLSIFANYMPYTLNQVTGDTDAQIKMSSMGLHVSYDWIEGSGSKLFGWGGIKITTGVERNATELLFNSKINKQLNYNNGGFTYSSDIKASPTAIIDVATTTIPLNISTSVQMLYFLSLYGGVGADYNMGKATGKGTLNSSPAVVNCNPGPSNAACPNPGANDPTGAGTINTSANIDGSGKVNPFLFRGFAGIQFNLPYMRIFVQGDKSFGDNLVGATAGVRFVY